MLIASKGLSAAPPLCCQKPLFAKDRGEGVTRPALSSPPCRERRSLFLPKGPGPPLTPPAAPHSPGCQPSLCVHSPDSAPVHRALACCLHAAAVPLGNGRPLSLLFLPVVPSVALAPRLSPRFSPLSLSSLSCPFAGRSVHRLLTCTLVVTAFLFLLWRPFNLGKKIQDHRFTSSLHSTVNTPHGTP